MAIDSACFFFFFPLHKQIETFDGLLLHVYLVFNDNTVKTSIFEEVQKSYGLERLKLIKVAVTRWLSHGKAVQRVLDQYPQVVDTLSKIYEWNKEPAVQEVL